MVRLKMPRNKRYRRRRIMRRKTKVPRRHMTLVNRGTQPIPDRFICKMKYSQVITPDGTGQQIMNLNSIYDPDRSGVGHQPYGFDYLANLYSRYRVISCGWVIQRAAAVAEATTPILVGCIPSNDASVSYTDFDYLRESPRARWILQNPGATALTLKGKSYIPSLVGRTRAQYMADDRYQSEVNSNPQENALLYIQVANGVTGSPTPAAVHVILEYTVEFFDRKHLLQS